MHFLSKKLEKRGHKVDILTIDYPKIKFIGLIFVWVSLFKQISKFLKADVIHIHDVFIWFLPLRMLLFWKPVVTTHHGWEGVFPIPVKNIFLKNIAYYLSNNNIIVGKYINKFYKLSCKNIIYGAINIPAKKRYIKNKKSIIYIGRLSKDTGLPVLLKTLRHFRDYNIEFLGDGELKSECEKYGKVHGFVKNVDKYLSNSEVIFCSGYLTILESFANKCKVVTAFDNKLKKDYYMNTPFSDWIATGNSPKQIYESYKKLNSKSVEKAFEWVEKRSWENLATCHDRLYNDLI